jgi:hypothetical protein
MGVYIRCNGDSTAASGPQIIVVNNVTTQGFSFSRGIFATDDAQIVEWKSSAAVGDTESFTLDVCKYWEWA